MDRLAAMYKIRPVKSAADLKTRGPALVELANGTFFDLWYDRQTKCWVLILRNEAGDQIGPSHGGAAEYVHERSQAVDTIIEHEKKVPRWEARVSHDIKLTPLDKRAAPTIEEGAEDRIMFDSGTVYVYDTKSKREGIEVRINTGHVARIDSAYSRTADGLALAIARAKYLANKRS
jgi:hypothetical protein